MNQHTCQKCGYFWCDEFPIAPCPSCNNRYPAFSWEQELTITRIIRHFKEADLTPSADPSFEITGGGYKAMRERDSS